MLGKIGFFGIVGLALFVVVSQTGGNAAQATLAQSCPSGPGAGVTLTLVWPAPGEGATETWLDLGLSGVFDASTSQSYGPFDPMQTSYAIASLPVGTKYHYRVQARKADATWRALAEGTFTAKCGEPPVPVSVTQRCVEGPVPGPADDGVTAVFAWETRSSGEQWVDVSTQGPGFAPGTFEGFGPAASGDPAYEVTGLARATAYWWRVNVRTTGGWLTSVPADLVTLPCPRA